MKMRLTGLLAFTLLSLSLLSYGVSGAVFADSHDILPLSATPDSDIVSNGNTVIITGFVKNYNATDGKVITYKIITPDIPDTTDSKFAGIAQFTPAANGTFSTSIVATGKYWEHSGDYIVAFNYGINAYNVTINYIGGENPNNTVVISPPPSNNTVVIPPPPPPLNNTVVIPPPPPPLNNTVVISPVVPVCDPGTVLNNGVCTEICGDGTEWKNGTCVVIKDGGGCLVATAAYGTEMAPQIQFLREVRDNTVLSTASGVAFMSGFNTIYYSFAPAIADMERENPMFQQTVKAFVTPMISSLSIMSLAEDGSETDVLALGISVIALNLGLYIAAPALIGFKIHKHIKSRV